MLLQRRLRLPADARAAVRHLADKQPAWLQLSCCTPSDAVAAAAAPLVPQAGIAPIGAGSPPASAVPSPLPRLPLTLLPAAAALTAPSGHCADRGLSGCGWPAAAPPTSVVPSPPPIGCCLQLLQPSQLQEAPRRPGNCRAAAAAAPPASVMPLSPLCLPLTLPPAAALTASSGHRADQGTARLRLQLQLLRPTVVPSPAPRLLVPAAAAATRASSRHRADQGTTRLQLFRRLRGGTIGECRSGGELLVRQRVRGALRHSTCQQSYEGCREWWPLLEGVRRQLA